MRDIDLAYRFGASTYLRKPGTFGELVRLVALLGAYWFKAAELPDHDFHPSNALPVKPNLKGTVLVVDDSSFARKILTQILKLVGHNVFEAVDGENALGLYVTEKPDLVLLDLVLSSLSGREVLEKLLEIDPGARVLITTADVQQITRDELIDMGAIGVLYKPFDPKATLDSVDAAMKKPPADK